jgi:hypothetical protein
VKREELTYEEFCNLPFDYVFGMTTDVCAARRWVCKEYGLVKEIITDRKIPGDVYAGWKNPRVCFYMDDEPLSVWYPNNEVLYEAYMHKVCGVPYEWP